MNATTLLQLTFEELTQALEQKLPMELGEIRPHTDRLLGIGGGMMVGVICDIGHYLPRAVTRGPAVDAQSRQANSAVLSFQA